MLRASGRQSSSKFCHICCDAPSVLDPACRMRFQKFESSWAVARAKGSTHAPVMGAGCGPTACGGARDGAPGDRTCPVGEHHHYFLLHSSIPPSLFLPRSFCKPALPVALAPDMQLEQSCVTILHAGISTAFLQQACGADEKHDLCWACRPASSPSTTQQASSRSSRQSLPRSEQWFKCGQLMHICLSRFLTDTNTQHEASAKRLLPQLFNPCSCTRQSAHWGDAVHLEDDFCTG